MLEHESMLQACNRQCDKCLGEIWRQKSFTFTFSIPYHYHCMFSIGSFKNDPYIDTVNGWNGRVFLNSIKKSLFLNHNVHQLQISIPQNVFKKNALKEILKSQLRKKKADAKKSTSYVVCKTTIYRTCFTEKASMQWVIDNSVLKWSLHWHNLGEIQIDSPSSTISNMIYHHCLHLPFRWLFVSSSTMFTWSCITIHVHNHNIHLNLSLGTCKSLHGVWF